MAKTTIYSRRLSRNVAKDATNSGKYHIIPGNSHMWSVVPEGSIRASKVFRSRANAIRFARKAGARRSFSQIVVHDNRGSVIQEITV